MGAQQEDVIRRFLDAWGDGETELPDIDVIVDCFAEDATWQLWVPGGPTLRGKEAIRADIHRQVKFSTHMKCGLLGIASNGTSVMTERRDSFRSGESTVTHCLMAIYDLDENDKIVSWREYFDYKDIEKQLEQARVVVPRVGT